MTTKKYLSYDRLGEYDALIKAEIVEGDESTLLFAKAYTDEKIAAIPEVDAYTKSEIDSAIVSVKEYTDEAVASLLNNSTEAVDSIYELRDAMQENAGAIEALVEISGNKADKDHVHSWEELEDKPFGEIDVEDTEYFCNVNYPVSASSVHAFDGPWPAGTYRIYADGVKYPDVTVNGGTSNVGSSESFPFYFRKSQTGPNPLTDCTWVVVFNDKSIQHTVTVYKVNYITKTIDEKYIPDTIASTVYVNDALDNKADNEHTHAIADVTGLQDALDAKATQTGLNSLTEVVNGKAASVHTHAISEVTNLQTTLDAKATQANLDSHTGDTVKHITADERAAWNAIEGKAKTYTDQQIAAIPTPDVSGQISAHNSNTSAHGDIRKLISDVEASIPDALSDLTADSTHRTVTDAEKATWNAKSNFSGNYNDLTNKPSIPSITGLATEKYVDDSVSTKVDKVTGKGLSTNDYTTTEKNKLSGIATGAEVNQNAFSNVVVGSTTISADSKTDSLTIDAGTGISVAGDDTNDKVTITNSGVRSIATGSANGTISVNTNGTSVDVSVKGLGSAAYTASTAYDAAGTAKAKADDALNQSKGYTDEKIALLMNNSSAAVDSIMELAEAMEANDDVVEALETAVGNKADKSDLTNHINNKSNPHGVTLEQLGVTATAAELNIMDGVTATAAEINKLDGVTATTAELNYVDGVTSNIQTQLNAKQATVTGAATTITGSNLTASRALVSNSSGKVAVSAVTSTELGYLDGVTSNIQEQLDTKATVQIITWGADD